METVISAFSGIVDGIGPFLILLGLLIFVHELGHFLVAKLCGVRVETFSLGFGHKILKFKRGDTVYAISWIPLGGYVKMFGDDPSKDVEPSEREYSFLHKPVAQRIAIVLAGPLMNLAFAFFLFILIGITGEPVAGPWVGDIKAATRAYEAGFRSGDKILSINGKAINSWLEAKNLIGASANQKLEIEVERENSMERAQIKVTPVLGENDNILSHKNQVGVIEGLDALSYAAMIGVMGPDTPAAKAGLRSLDLITKINHRDVFTWRDLDAYLREDLFKGHTPVKLLVESYADSDKPKAREVILDVPPATIEMPAHGQAATTVPRVVELSDLGIEPAQLYLWKVKRGSPADQAGLKTGDRIMAIDGQPIREWSQVIDIVKAYNPDRPAPTFTFLRDGQEQTATVKPELTELLDARGRDERRFTIGIVSGMVHNNPRPVIIRTTGLIDLIALGVTRSIETSGMVIMSIVRLVQGDVSAKNIGGIISIGRVANQSYEAGLSQFLKMMALISINLFLLNLLPVPILDGGHLVFFSIEALRGAPLSMRKMEIAQQVGLVLLMSLMVFALFNDISNWLNSIW